MGRGRRMPGGMPGGMPGNKNNMMKQIQKMQDEMLKAQAELEEKEVEATAGGGAVKVTVSGKKMITSVKIDHGSLQRSVVKGRRNDRKPDGQIDRRHSRIILSLNSRI